MAILLDTGFYAGLIHPKDEHHQASMDLLNQIKNGRYGQVYTSNYIMTETATLCSIRSEQNPRVLATCQDYFIGTLKLAIMIYARDVNDKEAWELFQKLSQDASIKKPVSFIDCTNIILVKHYQIEYIASFDPHFDAWLTRIPSS